MKVLFLDIDGVLNSIQHYLDNADAIKAESGLMWRSLAELDRKAVALLNDFCLEHDLKIVISSTWRKLHNIFELRAILEKAGLEAEIIDYTPDLRGNWRGGEVKLWLSSRDDVEAYIIFDDDGDFDTDQPLIKTSYNDGLQPAHISLAKERLLNARTST